MKKVIIAEKPSLARNIQNALSKIDNFQVAKYDTASYSEGNVYIITSGFGHLFSLYDVADYKQDETLPFVPSPFKLKIKQKYITDNMSEQEKKKTEAENQGTKKQFEMIKHLISRDDVDGVIHCGDADREGEVIVRLILSEAHNQKPVYRLWLPEQTEDTILKSINNMKMDSEYDNLYQEGLARMYIDWLFGINYSRYMKQKTGMTFNVGRVLVPIVEAIYNRELEIKNFTKKKYYQAVGKADSYTIPIDKKFDSIVEAKAYVNILNSRNTYVKNIEEKEVEIESKKLFSLDTLQGYLAQKFEMTMDYSLSVIQKLYEAGYVTYPRTNTEYLAEAEKDKMRQVISKINNAGHSLIFKESKKIFDDSKVESHSALTPTLKLPDLDALSVDEKKIYTTIFNRFCAVFSPNCIVMRTTVTIENGNEEFKLSGDVIKSPGFLIYEPREEKDDTLPNFTIGERLEVTYEIKECETKAPSRYSVASLNRFLKAPFKEAETEENEAEDDDMYKMIIDGLEIGTVGTRPGIIKNAIKYGYISLKKNKFTCEPKGIKLMEYMAELKIDLYKKKSVEFSKILKLVYTKKINVPTAVAYTARELQQVLSLDIAVEKMGHDPNKEVIGLCPFCRSSVMESEKVFYCEKGTECGFFISKSNPYINKLTNKNITSSMMKKFLMNDKVKINDIPSSKGTTYSIKLAVDFVKTENNGRIFANMKFSQEFCNPPKKRSPGKSNKLPPLPKI